MRRHTAPVHTALLAALLIAGCTGLPGPQGRTPARYVLDARPAMQASRVKHDLILAVSMPQAGPGFETTQIAYMRKTHQLEYFANSRWMDTPPRMLHPLLRQALEQSGGFRAVTQTAIPADIRLDTELLRLQHDFTAHPSRVRITLRAQLIDVRSKRVLALREFDESENADEENAYGGVSAASRLVQRLLGQVTEFCIAASGGH